MIHGFDVSHHQDPDRLDFKRMAEWGMFLIARTSFGAKTADRRFAEFAQGAREHGVRFGCYHFYRQVHPAEEQLALVMEQLDSIGGLRPGDLFPALDMEVYPPDGNPQPKLWNAACDAMGDAWKAQYGGCILYMSAYFPSYIGHAADSWMHEPGYRFWVAHYKREPGKADNPYGFWRDEPFIHQHKGDHGWSELYADGAAPIDMNAFTGTAEELAAWTVPRVGGPEPAEPHRLWPAEVSGAFARAADGAALLAAGLQELSSKG